MEKMIYILVPVFRRLNETKKFLASLEIAAPGPYRVIVTDDSPDYEHFNYYKQDSAVSVVKGNGELYWGGGINLCISFLQDKFQVNSDDIIVFANNDIEVKEDMIGVMTSLLKENDKAIYHPRIIDQTGKLISPGSRVTFWPLFITKHELEFTTELLPVDLASARFLMFTFQTLIELEGIDKKLPHYQGDNDFTLRAKKMGIPTFIVSRALCQVDESETGDKINNIIGFRAFFKSYGSIKSPNSIKYRYRFISNHFSPLKSFFIVLAMSIKSFILFLLKRLRFSSL